MTPRTSARPLARAASRRGLCCFVLIALVASLGLTRLTVVTAHLEVEVNPASPAEDPAPPADNNNNHDLVVDHTLSAASSAAPLTVGGGGGGRGGPARRRLSAVDFANIAQVAKLLAADGAAGDAFGWSVAIEGDTMVVGTYYSSSAYVFTRDVGVDAAVEAPRRRWRGG